MEKQEGKDRDKEEVLKTLRAFPEVELVTEPDARETRKPYAVLLKAGRDISMDVIDEISICLRLLGYSKLIMNCINGGLIVYGMSGI